MAKRSRGSVNDRPPKWKLFVRRQRWLLPYAAWGCAGLAGFAVCVVLLRNAQPGDSIASIREKIGVMTGDAGMRIADIKIEGRANTPEPILLAALGVNRGDPIIGFSLEQARARIEKLTWIAHATVERRLPGTIVVALTERRPFAVWQTNLKDTLIDRDGKEVANEDITKYENLPLIVGAGAPKAARLLLDALTDRPIIQARVLAAVRVGERRWNLRLKNHTDVMLPETHEIEALNRLLELHQATMLLDRPLAAIDMRLPDKLVLRPLAPHSAEATTDKQVPPAPPPAPKKPI